LPRSTASIACFDEIRAGKLLDALRVKV